MGSRSDHDFKDLGAAEHVWNEFHHNIAGFEGHRFDGTADPTQLAHAVAHRVADGSLRYSTPATDHRANAWEQRGTVAGWTGGADLTMDDLELPE